MDRKQVLIHIVGRDTAMQLEEGIRHRRKKIARGEDCGPALHIMTGWYKIPRIKLIARATWGERVIVHPTFGHLSRAPLELIKLPVTFLFLGIVRYVEETFLVKSE